MTSLSEKIAVGLLIGISVIVALLDLTGYLEAIPIISGRISALTLLILAAIAGYLAANSSNRQQEQREIVNKIEQNTSKLIKSLNGVDVEVLDTTEKGFEYLCKRYNEAEQNIDHASLAPSLIADSAVYKKYEMAVGKATKSSRVTYRYLAIMNEKRWRLIRDSFQLSHPRYYVRYYQETPNITPVLSFAIIDNKELIVRFSYDRSEPGYWLVIKQADLISLFNAYYKSLWSNAIKVEMHDLQHISKLENEYFANK